MPLESFSELMKIDVTPHCKKRDGALYLPWGKCKMLLHEHGAHTVYFTPIRENGSYLLESRRTQNKDGRETGCYFVAVDVVIDSLRFRMDYPLLNGSNPVYDNSLNQLRISNAHARAFVKGVAIHTGLGFSLWLDEEDAAPEENLEQHSIMKIKRRAEEKITILLQRGMELKDICAALGKSEREFQKFFMLPAQWEKFETDIDRLMRK